MWCVMSALVIVIMCLIRKVCCLTKEIQDCMDGYERELCLCDKELMKFYYKQETGEDLSPPDNI